MRTSLTSFALLLTIIASRGWAQSSAEFNPLAPALDRLEARFERIEREIARLRGAGMPSEAEAMSAELQYFRSRFTGSAAPRTGDPALDLIGVVRPAAENRPVDVEVWRIDRPVVLALTSAEPVEWNVSVQEGSQLAKVIVYGDDPSVASRVAGVPPGVPVEIYGHDSGGEFTYRRDYTNFPRTAAWLRQLTGMSVSSVQGVEQPQGVAFSVGIGNTTWHAQRVLSEMQPLYEQATAFERERGRAAAEGLRFTGILRGPGDTNREPSRSIRDFDAFRVLGDGRSIALDVPMRQVAVDTAGGRYFGIHSRNGYVHGELAEIDPATGAPSDLPPTPNNIAPVTEPIALAFDTKRDRLVVMARAAREPFLYAHSPGDGRWSVLGIVDRNTEVGSLAYSAAHDALFGLTFGTPSLLRFDPHGALVDRISLSHVLPTNSWDDGAYQLFAIDDKLGLLTPPYSDLDHPHLPPEQRFLLIEPTTGEVIYSGIVAIPEPGFATLFFSAAAAFGLARRRGRGGFSGT